MPRSWKSDEDPIAFMSRLRIVVDAETLAEVRRLRSTLGLSTDADVVKRALDVQRQLAAIDGAGSRRKRQRAVERLRSEVGRSATSEQTAILTGRSSTKTKQDKSTGPS